MKNKKREKLHLNKITIQNLDDRLDRNDQEAVKGGSNNTDSLTTVTPVYCQP